MMRDPNLAENQKISVENFEKKLDSAELSEFSFSNSAAGQFSTLTASHPQVCRVFRLNRPKDRLSEEKEKSIQKFLSYKKAKLKFYPGNFFMGVSNFPVC